MGKNPRIIDTFLASNIAADDRGLSYKPVRLSTYVEMSALSKLGSFVDFTVCCWNCHVTGSYDEIVDFLARCPNIQIMNLCETFLNVNTMLSSYNFPVYKLTVRCRTGLSRGGVAFLVKQ